MRVTPKLMPPVLLCWPVILEADVGDMAVEVEPFHQYSIKFCCRATDDSRGAVWQNGIRHGSAYEAKVCDWIPAPSDIHRCLLNIYRDQTVDVSTVREWVACFSSGNNDVKGKPCSGWPCTAVTPWNEECFDQLICKNRWITTRELCTKLNIGFSALEVMVSMLEYRKICARWVPRMVTQEHKEQHMQVCQGLLNQYETEGDSFLDRIITGDETWCHHYEPESKQQSMEWWHVNSPSKKKFKTLPSAGKVMCTLFWDRKGVILLDFLGPGQTINSDRYIATLTKLKARISSQAREEDNLSLAIW